jgi:integrase
MGERLSDKIVKRLPAPARGNRIVYDSEVKGFGARITAAGTVAFVLNYRRRADGLERRYTIGSHPDWSVAAARERAKELKRHVDGGGDPVGEHVADRAAPTVADLCTRFAAEHVPKLRASTQRYYRGILKNEIVPALGTMKVAAVEYEHIDRLNAKITKRAPYMANRTLAVLSKMFALAIRWKMRPDSPVRGIERNQEIKRKRYLSAAELDRLTRALAEYPNHDAANVFRLLLLTGARRSEVQSATWDQFDLGRGLWRKPGATTKQKTDHEVPLSAPARQLLSEIYEQQGTATTFVFPGPGPQGHRTGFRRHWERICEAAEITGLRIHDLRHSYASMLAGAGFSLPTIGALLGHSQPATTARYAHLSHDPLREATERIGAIISGGVSGAIVKLPTRVRNRRDGGGHVE